MYDPNVEFHVPQGIEDMAHELFEKYILPFSDPSLLNEVDIQQIIKRFAQIEKDINIPLCLLQLIKEILLDENELYIKYLYVITSYLNRLIEVKKYIILQCISNDEFQNDLTSSILFLLPYSASLFQETNQIQCFSQLFSCLIKIIDVCSATSLILFNQYIDFLLADDNPYQEIISMFYASQFKPKGEVKDKILVLINNILTRLPLFDPTSIIEQLFYDLIFNHMRDLLTNFLKTKMVNLSFFIETIEQYITNFISKYSKNPDEYPTEQELDLIESIISFVLYFLMNSQKQVNRIENGEEEEFAYYDKNGNIEDNPNFLTSFYLASLIYKYLHSLIIASRYCLSRKIGAFIIRVNEYIIYQSQKSDPEEFYIYLLELLYELSIFTLEDLNQIESSTESFYFDFYDIDFYKFDYYSYRQSLALFIFEYTKSTQNSDLIRFIALNLNQLTSESMNQQNGGEPFYYFLSILNIIASELRITNEEIILTLHDLTVQFIENGSEIVTGILSQDSMDDYQKVFTFTYYFFINSSFYVLTGNTEVISSFNLEIERLMAIITKCYEEDQIDYTRIFFTFFCILVNNMMDVELLTNLQEQFYLFIMKFYDCCFTNHCITLNCKFSLVLKKPEFVIKTFYDYFDSCKQMLVEIIGLLKKNGGKNEDEEEDFEIPCTKDTEYILRYFSDNVSKMARIITILGLDVLDAESIFEFVNFLITRCDNTWYFQDESVLLMSSLLTMTTDIKETTNFYMTALKKSHRIDNNYGEFLIPLIIGISYRVDVIDQEYIDIMIHIIKETIDKFITQSFGESEQHQIYTFDALLFFTCIARLFEYGVSENINFDINDVIFFVNLAIELLPPDDENCGTDYHRDDHELGAIILKLASYLAMSEIDQDELYEFLVGLVNEKQIVCDSMRYIIVYLIDFVLKTDDKDLLQLRELCLNNTIEKSEKFVSLYIDNLKYFVGYIRHPISLLAQIDNFVFDGPNDDPRFTAEEEDNQE